MTKTCLKTRNQRPIQTEKQTQKIRRLQKQQTSRTQIQKVLEVVSRKKLSITIQLIIPIRATIQNPKGTDRQTRTERRIPIQQTKTMLFLKIKSVAV